MITVEAAVKNNLLQPSDVLLPPTNQPIAKNQGSLSLTQQDIALLWVKMAKAYGYKFINNFGEKDTGIWFEALKDLTSDDLDYGFKKMLVTITDEERKKHEAWPPNVKEFRMYCERRLKDFDLPEVHEAFSEAQNNNYLSRPYWSHPLVLTAKNRLNKRPNDYVMDEDYRSFSAIYRDLCQKFMRGEAMNLLNGK